MQIESSAKPAFLDNFGRNSTALLRGMTTLAPFVILARAFTAGGQLFAGRLLGPGEFGTVNIALAVSAILSIPLQGFVGAMVKFGSMETTHEGQSKVISTALWLHFGFAAFCCLGFAAFHRPLAGFLHVSGLILAVSVAYTLALSAYAMTSTLPQVILRFGERGLVELVYGVATVVSFVAAFYALGLRTWIAFLNSMSVALLLSGAISTYRMRAWISFRFSREVGRSLYSYFLPAIAAASTAAITQAAIPLIIAANLSAAHVGFFSIYELGSIGIAAVISQIVCTVLFPLVAAPDKQRGAWNKFFLLAVPLTLSATVGFSIVEFAILKLAGRSYPIRLDWILLFSATAALLILYGAAQIMLSARDAASAWLGTAGNAINGVILVLAALWAVPRYQFLGGVISMLIAYGISFFWFVGWGLWKTRWLGSA